MKVLKIKGLREIKEGLTNGDRNGDFNVENGKGKWKLITRDEERERLTVWKKWKGNLSLWISLWNCGQVC